MNLSEALSLLELQQDYTESDLKSAYRKMARKYHPDLVGGAGDKMSQINMAYNICHERFEKEQTKPDVFDRIMKKYDKMFDEVFFCIADKYDRMFDAKFAEIDNMFKKQR